MKGRIIASILAAFFCVGCKTTTYHPLTDKFPVTREFDASYGRVWQATIASVSKKGRLADANKTTGIIRTKRFSLGPSLFAERELKRYAVPPFALIVVWSKAEASLDVSVNRSAKGVIVGVTGEFTGFELYGSHQVEKWYSQGVMETQLLDDIGRSIR